MIIKKLEECPLLIIDVATIRWNEWYEWNKEWIVLSDIIEETKKYSSKIFIALDNNESLIWFWWIFKDSWINKIVDWLWLKSLYVKDEYRKKWVATKILEIIKKEVKNNNDNIYLYDSSWIDWFYEKQWFKFIEKYSFNKNDYCIYVL